MGLKESQLMVYTKIQITKVNYILSTILVSSLTYSNTRALGVTHKLEACLDILISGSYLLKHWRETHLLDVCVHSCQ